VTFDNDLETTLERLGADGGPPADPAFANRLDAALRTAHAERLTEQRRRSLWLPIAAAVSAIATVIVGVMFWMAVVDGEASSDLVMTAATDTDVVLPGEATTVGTPGLLLPDGARILVGPNGEAVVDGVVLGPGAEAVVTDGRLELLEPADRDNPDLASVPTTEPPPTGPADAGSPDTDPSTTRTMSDSTTPVTDAATDRTRPDGDRGDDQRDPGRSTTVPKTSTTDDRRTTATSSGPSTSRPQQTSSTAETAPTRPTAAPTTTTTSEAASVTLTATALPRGRVRLDWETTNIGAAPGTPAGFRVEAAVDDRASTLVVIRSPSVRSTTIERLAAADAVYWVEALDSDGNIVAASNAVTQPAP
jgi:hypothetical protein